jgi:hypothetical protein
MELKADHRGGSNYFYQCPHPEGQAVDIKGQLHPRVLGDGQRLLQHHQASFDAQIQDFGIRRRFAGGDVDATSASAFETRVTPFFRIQFSFPRGSSVGCRVFRKRFELPGAMDIALTHGQRLLLLLRA